ncbi:MAG: hypothetical protein JOS17DRAFT_791396 [Linnemannia elongata]|nr:MAG: hypothetical protein JOS17DRAFT_791396 [Linnemannia elongata]
MVRLTKALLGAVLALSVVLTPALSQVTNSSKPAPSGPAGNATATSTPTTNFILPTPAPTPAPPVTSNPDHQVRCPAIMIPDPDPGIVIHGRACVGGCCVRCPAINSFYEPHKVDNILKAAYFIRQASLGFAIFMAISYLVLPGKRSQPHISVLFLTVSLSLWYAAFDVMPGYSNACANDVDPSTGSNNKLCGVQGVLIIYLTQTSALWCSLLIYKLHLLAVWRSNWIDAHYAYFTAFCWVFPLAFAIPVAVKNLAEYPGIGFSCLVGTENLNTYLFYPVAVYMYPAMICHVVTVGKMIRLAVMSSKIDTGLSQLSTDARMKVTTTMQAKRLLRGQWRPALMVGTVMTCLTVFWLFYFVDTHSFAKTNETTPWLKTWMGCIFMQAKLGKSGDEMQTICADAARPNLPSIHWFAAAEVLLALLGVVVASVFISKAEFWEEWGYLLGNVFQRGKRGNGSRSSSGGSRSPDNNGHGSNSPTMVNRHPSNHSGSLGEIARKGGPMARSMGSNHGLHNDMHGGGPTAGVFRSNSQSLSTKNLTSDNAQWYDMDDLLDKEYELQEQQQPTSLHHASSSHLQRNVSFSSRPAGTGNSVPIAGIVNDPPKYSSGNLASPTRAYFNPSTSDRDTFSPYTEKPVVPTPVPRTPRLTNTSSHSNSPPTSQQQHIYLSSPKLSSASPPQSPTASYRTGGSGANNSHALDSVPIIGIATRGSPAMSATSYTHTPRSPRGVQPQNPSHQAQQPYQNQPPTAQSLLYNANDSSEQIMVASRESIGRAPPSMGGMPTSPTSPTSPVNRSKSPPPSLPHKNPHRHHQPGYMSPPIQLPVGHQTNNNNNFYRD